ncbi:TldD/PmbA family protein [Fusibacter tunisiensis]|uniref:PmbA protein n=1 Tax=Fusibacter tunisiensis TaxID=1008308 RepID=A0ABS2MR63_9FIRM|nr:TldD/PmbA family protein [Fusibacter tunisiensis]MBM7561908.1 PmbA protein [Fusibacter tunisiensis]
MDRTLIDQLFELGKARGFSAQEIFYQESKDLAISVYEGEVDRFTSSQEGGMSYRGILNGKMGYAYTESVDASVLEFLVNEAAENAEVIESEDVVFLHDGSGRYKEMDFYNPKLDAVTVEEKIKILLKLEKELKSFDPRIKRISNNRYSESASYKWLKNTEGLDVTDRQNHCLAYAMVIAEENGDTRTGFAYDLSRSFEDLNIGKIVEESASEALSLLGAEPIESGSMPVVFKNDVFAQFFSAFMGIFNAERVQKELSPLKGRINDVIASEKLTLIDDPHLKNGMASSAFDAEGVATFSKRIIENGILRSFLYNLKTAHKDGIKSTGNASKASYKGTLGIAPFNIYIEGGENTLTEMMETLSEGIYITGLQGLHAGLDPVSGDFSLQSNGYTIVGGKVDRPVSQITVSGNFYDLLNQITGIANDLEFTILGSGYMGSPSVSVSNLTISGK